MAEPVLSVVVPTRDRAHLLHRCIESLMAARAAVDDDVEVIVVDDASTDGSAAVAEAFDGVRVIQRAEDGGSSAARNDAVAVAKAPLILFVDDDIVVGDDFMKRHLEHHRLRPQVEEALVGLVTWSRDQRITGHMRWLERGGPLFAFDTITDPDDVDPAHFCTANVSVKRALLDRVDGPFEAGLRRFTDVELGRRLAASGMRLRFAPDLVGWHLRHDTPASTDARMRAVGRASVELERLHPGSAPPASTWSRTGSLKARTARLLSPLAPMLPGPVADRIWSARAAWAYAEGRREAGATS